MQAGRLSFKAITGYQSPLVWMIEKSASVLIILFVFYFLSMLMPGLAGEQFRALIAKLCTQTLQFAFHMASKLAAGTVRVLMQLLTRLIAGEKIKSK